MRRLTSLGLAAVLTLLLEALCTENAAQDKDTLNATGHVVAPGFIDTHTHSKHRWYCASTAMASTLALLRLLYMQSILSLPSMQNWISDASAEEETIETYKQQPFSYES